MTGVYLLFQLFLLTWYKHCSLLQFLNHVNHSLSLSILHSPPSCTHRTPQMNPTPAIKLDTGLKPVQSALPIYIITACTVNISLS